MDEQESTNGQVWTGAPSRKVIERKLVYFFTGFWIVGMISLIIADLTYFSDPIVSTLILVLGPLSSLLVLLIGAVHLRRIGKIWYEVNDSEVSTNSNRIPRSEIQRIEVKKSIFDLPAFHTGTITFYDAHNTKLPVKFVHIEDVNKVAALLK
ncbi:MAG: PH domain-containing protein [Candidatus Helarchaeota archaeon]